MATIREKNGKYFIDYRIHGRRVRKTIGYSREAAEEALKEIESKIIKAKSSRSELSKNIQDLLKDFVLQSKVYYMPEHKEAYSELEKAAFYLDSIADALVVITSDGKISRINRAFCRIWGYSPEEVREQSILNLFPAEEQEKHKAEMETAIQTGATRDFETTTITKDGRKISLMVSRSVIKGTDGEVTGFLDVFKDITALKAAETKLKVQCDKAELYFDIADVMMIVINSDGIVDKVNKKGCEILGYNKEEVAGQNWFDKFIPKEAYQDVKDVFKQLMSGQVEPVEYYENPVITKTGEEKLVAWHNAVIRDDRGHITGTLSSGEDITERKKVKEQLDIFRKDLLKTNQALKERSLRDTQTGLYNHNYLQDTIEKEFERAKRHTYPLSVVMIDIDYFKSINNVYGHHFGDLILKQFSEYLKKSFIQNITWG